MRKPLIILPGQQFAWLTIVEEAERKCYDNGATVRKFKVRCKCGSVKVVALGNLSNGAIKSCGCWSAMNVVARSTKHGLCTRLGKHPLYGVWQAMKNRCHQPNVPAYKDYGARGITVCDEWRADFARFLCDMGERPDGMTVERIDNDKGYSKENCRWATQMEQGSNRRNNVVLTLNGATHHIAQWSRITGVKTHTLHARYRAGKPVEEILAPVRHGRHAGK